MLILLINTISICNLAWLVWMKNQLQQVLCILLVKLLNNSLMITRYEFIFVYSTSTFMLVALTCRDDLDSKWRLLLAENELSRVPLLS